MSGHPTPSGVDPGQEHQNAPEGPQSSVSPGTDDQPAKRVRKRVAPRQRRQERQAGHPDHRPALLLPPTAARSTPESPWLTSDQAVEYLGLASRRALYGMVNRGLIPAYKLGGRYYFRRDELDAVIAHGRIGSTPVVSAVGSGR